MKKLLLLFCMLGFGLFSYAQEDEFETISFGADFFRQENIPKPIVRQVIGGTVIQVQYEGDEWERNLDRKNAFEHACRILEEQMKTALPIKVKVKFGKLRGQNVIAKTVVYTDTCVLFPRGERMLTPRTAMKWILRDRGPSDANVTVDFFDFPDGLITFNEEDIFSYSLDYVKEDKYDFVTVALRELCKVMGFLFSVPGDNTNKVLDISQDKLLLYDKIVLYNKSVPAEAYNYATSGNVLMTFGYGGSGDKYSMYSPSVFENGRSLSYFKTDEANNETRLMQPDLPRGTSIRNVGKWFRPFLEAMGWYTDVAVGSGGGGQGDIPSTSTDKVEEYGKDLSFKMPGNRSVNSSFAVNSLNVKGNNQVFDESDLYEYIEQFDTYPTLNIMSGFPLLGWSVSILCKDGTWDVVSKYTILYPEIQFSTSEIDPIKALNYARSSDGYLRCKLIRIDWDYYGDRQEPGIYTFAHYFLLDYLPQKPQMVFSKAMPQTRAAVDEYSVDVKIAFKNVEGTERILVEQLEEGSPVPFTYYVENVADGYFIATVDKEYSTTFKLRAINKNGETISEQLFVAPLEPPTRILEPHVNGNFISVELENHRKKVVDMSITDYKILDLKSSMVVGEGKVYDNKIDISLLEKGLYGLYVTDENSKSYDAKFMKK